MRLVGLALGGLVVAAAPLAGQQDSLARAFELERRGNYAAAVPMFEGVLRGRPGDVNALLGLERALMPQGRTAELLPALRAALAANPGEPAVHGVAIRTWGVLGPADSVRAAALRWAAMQPGEDAPYREWGNALLVRRDRAGAKEAYLAGRRALGKPGVLAPELAELAAQEGNFVRSAEEWVLAIRQLPGYRPSALAYLRQAPESQRTAVLAVLERDPSPDVRRLDTELRARWGDPLGAFDRLLATLPADRVSSVEALRLFAESLRGVTTPEARLATGRALEAVAQRLPPAQAGRTRLDAAQAYLDGGDRTSARRMLSGLVDEAELPAALATAATGTLLRLLIDEGRLDEAESRLQSAEGRLPVDSVALLRRRVALGWAKGGRLDRADALAARDSTVDGLALRGRLRLLHGDVAGARTLLEQAGPYAGSRADATNRTMLLALLQPIEADSLPALGTAFLALERGDTATAVSALEQLAVALPVEQGGAELRLHAGRLEMTRGRAPQAEAHFRAAAASDDAAAAPAALLELGRLLTREGRGPEAVPVLEQLILSHPKSALVPQARRALDEARGAVPSA
ncbi:MAG: hypothetical protein MUC69_04985 [Gemmatimonadales bacterium]|nr:hypothetical protein [Gemmatimonadales bacterium]